MPAPLTVTSAGTQYWFDEDSAAWCDIAVRDGDAFSLVVVRARGISSATRFAINTWLHYAREVWAVDEETRQLLAACPEEPPLLIGTGDIVSTAIPGLTVPLKLVFGAG